MKKAMKITNTQIVSLQNIIYADLLTFGSGAKSNPFKYQICIGYINDITVRVDFEENQTAAENAFNNLLKELNEE